MTQEQHAAQKHNIKISNSPFEWLEKFKYLGANLQDQNFILKKSRAA
jgi:hypothetical protein